jgi:hypothetical protein
MEEVRVMKSWSEWFNHRVAKRRAAERFLNEYRRRELIRQAAKRGELGPRHHYAGLD